MTALMFKDQLLAGIVEDHFKAVQNAHANMAGQRLIDRRTFDKEIRLRIVNL